MSLSEAVAAFTSVVGPLTDEPAAPLRLNGAGSVTGPIRWLFSHWQELTPQQRRAALRLLYEPDSPQAATDQDVSVRPASFHGAAALADGPGTTRARALLPGVIKRIEGASGWTLSVPIELRLHEGNDDPAGGTVPVSADGRAPWKEDGTYVGGAGYGAAAKCRLGLSNGALAASDDVLRGVLAHEAFHCFVMNRFGADYYKAAPWLMEGSAAWVGEKESKGAFNPIISKGWDAYLETPGSPLFSRSYDAIGFYAHLDQQGASPWKRLASMFQAAPLSSGSGTKAFEAALGGLTASQKRHVLDTWSAGYARNPSLGEGWNVAMPGITETRFDMGDTVISNGSTVDTSAAAYANAIRRLQLTADLVAVEPAAGSAPVAGRLRAADGINRQLEEDLYCLKESCACPGAPASGDPPANMLPGVAHLAVTGATSGANVTIRGMSLTEYCERLSTAPPPKDPGRDPCLTGTWRQTTRFEDLPHYFGPAPGLSGATGGGGQIYRFLPNGRLTADFAETAPGVQTVSGITLTVRVRGTATARWSTKKDQLRVSDVDNSHVTHEVDVNGSKTVAPAPTGGIWATGGVAHYSCSGSTLVLTDGSPAPMVWSYTRIA